MTPSPAHALPARARDRFAAAPDAGMLTDLGVATRLAALACALALLVVLMLLPIAAPTHHLGETGWVTVALSLLVSSVVAVRILRWPELVTPNELMLYSYLALALIVTLQWLGGPRSPYMELFLVAALYTAAVHRPRRVIAYLVVLALAACAPLLYSPRWDDAEGLMLAAHVVLWAGAALLTMQFLRLGRQGLHREGEALRELARVDPLTRLGNRRAFDEALDRAIAGARRWARPLSVVVVDLVAFKAINDRFGHLEGDRCLRGVGGALLYTVRAPDACFRWGGDEFALVLPASDLAAGELVGERLRRTVAERVVLPDGQPLRLSWAAAQLEDGMDAELLLAAADTRLMARKGSASRARATAHQPRA